MHKLLVYFTLARMIPDQASWSPLPTKRKSALGAGRLLGYQEATDVACEALAGPLGGQGFHRVVGMGTAQLVIFASIALSCPITKPASGFAEAGDVYTDLMHTCANQPPREDAAYPIEY
jgi:hypothetical protein